ncbi:hypothetical protein BCR43DRAFT_518352 [Syncephalastrum racemosum]|uniref:Uncharacterized protein n=1 Tax=Syncephalastrum racemosum TaxID=13706 RepID=A0A1X2H0J9_SYNRA|nr:hypothetical protein BCR43DRAFT_518352 [Syncephalastrum racemosum]
MSLPQEKPQDQEQEAVRLTESQAACLYFLEDINEENERRRWAEIQSYPRSQLVFTDDQQAPQVASKIDKEKENAIRIGFLSAHAFLFGTSVWSFLMDYANADAVARATGRAGEPWILPEKQDWTFANCYFYRHRCCSGHSGQHHLLLCGEHGEIYL